MNDVLSSQFLRAYVVTVEPFMNRVSIVLLYIQAIKVMNETSVLVCSCARGECKEKSPKLSV